MKAILGTEMLRLIQVKSQKFSKDKLQSLNHMMGAPSLIQLFPQHRSEMKSYIDDRQHIAWVNFDNII